MSEHLRRDRSEQVMALRDSAASLAGEGGDELARMLPRLGLRAVYYLNEPADSARPASSLVVQRQRVDRR